MVDANLDRGVDQPAQRGPTDADTAGVPVDAVAQGHGLLLEQVVDPVLFQGHELVIVLDVEQLVSLEVSVDEEDRGEQDLGADLEAADADRLRVVLVAVEQLEADFVVEQARRTVLQIRVGQDGEGLLERLVLAVAGAVGALDHDLAVEDDLAAAAVSCGGHG